MRRLEGRVAIVTGGASGIGEGCVRRFASEGAAVVIVDVDDEGAARVARAVEADGGTASVVLADVGSRTEVEAAVEAALSRHGRLDVMHNNAGVDTIGPLGGLDDRTVARMLDINVRGVLNGIAAAAPAMTEGGSIINTASTAALWGAANQTVYCATKGAVVSLTRAAALEHAPRIRVNALCPGGVLTPMVEKVFGAGAAGQADEVIGKLHPVGRMGRPEEVAAAAAFLASDDASFVTGTALVVDGGLTAGHWG